MYNSLILYDTRVADMTKVEYQIQINAPVQRVYEYYTNPNNIQKTWPQDIVKESQAKSDSKNEEGSEMRVKGQYMGKEEGMTLQVTNKEQNKKLEKLHNEDINGYFLYSDGSNLYIIFM